MKHKLKMQLSFSEDQIHLVAKEFYSPYAHKVWLFNTNDDSFVCNLKAFIQEALEAGYKIEWVKQ